MLQTRKEIQDLIIRFDSKIAYGISSTLGDSNITWNVPFCHCKCFTNAQRRALISFLDTANAGNLGHFSARDRWHR